MGNQSAEANNGQNEAIQNKRVCSSHLMDGSKDACNRLIHCNKSELTSSGANTMERLYQEYRSTPQQTDRQQQTEG